jgi:hypothetical protein
MRQFVQEDGREEEQGNYGAHEPALSRAPFVEGCFEDAFGERPGDEDKDDPPAPMKVQVDAEYTSDSECARHAETPSRKNARQ